MSPNHASKDPSNAAILQQVGLVCLGLAAPNWGCEQARFPPPAADEASVPVVMFTLASLDASPEIRLSLAWTTERRERVAGSTEYEFSRVRSIRTDDPGNIYVVDEFHPGVRVYDGEGRFRMQIGSRGQGPGEFPYARDVTVSGDTVFVLARETIEMFDLVGNFLARVKVGKELQWADALVHTTAGFLLVIRTIPSGSPGSTMQDSVYVRELDLASGSLGPPLLGLPGPVQYPLGRGVYVPAVMAYGPWLQIGGERVYSTLGDHFEIDVTNLEGDGVERWAADVPRTRASRADVRSVTTLRRQGLREQGFEWPRWSSVTGGAPRPRYRPTLGRLVVSRDGSLLVERLDLRPTWNSTDEETLWEWIAADGSLRGRIHMTAGFIPQVFEDGSLIGVQRDALDVPSIARYRIEVPPYPSSPYSPR